MPAIIADDDLPALFRAADKASTDAQSKYLGIIALDLSLLVIGATLGAVSFTSQEGRAGLALASAIVLVISIMLTIALKFQRLATTWYDGRAVAESVKTSAWRYMTQAEPYTGRMPAAEAARVLAEAFRAFLVERGELAASLPAALVTLPQITERMREVRALPLPPRRDLYLNERLGGQRVWYAKKAEKNRRDGRVVFILVLTSQGLALVAAILLVRWPLLPVNLVGVFAALAAALLAWNQLKRHEELATAYGLAAQELGTAQEQGRNLAEESDLSSFILNAENAISREHTLWLARRDHY
ncbi:MAG: DUF4231 domain-containing protein [Actinomycetota bacterium]